MTPEVKRRWGIILGIVKTVFHYGFIPFVLYLGISQGAEPGMPAISLASLFWE